MSFKFKPTALALSLFASLSVLGCNGAQPFFNDPSGTPTMVLPIATGSITGMSYSDTNNSLAGWNIFSTAVAVVAPTSGMVIQADNITGGGVTVTILHHARMKTRVQFLASTSLRAGDRVVAGQQIGLSSGTIQYNLLIDNASSCPYSFLDQPGRQISEAFLVTPCN